MLPALANLKIDFLGFLSQSFFNISVTPPSQLSIFSFYKDFLLYQLFTKAQQTATSSLDFHIPIQNAFLLNHCLCPRSFPCNNSRGPFWRYHKQHLSKPKPRPRSRKPQSQFLQSTKAEPGRFKLHSPESYCEQRL